MRIGTPMPKLEERPSGLAARKRPRRNWRAAPNAGPFLVHQLWYLQRQPAAPDQMARSRKTGRSAVIAVHMPRYEADTDVEAVRAAIAKYDISEPCAVDISTSCATRL